MSTTSLRLTRPHRLLAVAAVTLAATAAAAGIQPAGAADTLVTFELAAGALAITTPAGTATLTAGDAIGGSTVTGALETVTVADNRGALIGGWTATASSTAFTTGGATPDGTIPATGITYTAGVLTPSAGLPIGVGLIVTDLTTAKTVMTTTAVGSSTGNWTPSVSIAVPTEAVAGTYTGTITHSLS